MDDQKHINVLQVAYDLTMGGVPVVIMYPARILEKKDVSFDVLLTSDTIGFYDEEFKKYGAIYRIPVNRGGNKAAKAIKLYTNAIKVYWRTRKLLRDHQYDAIHCQNLSFNASCILAAHREHVPVRIAHSHVEAPQNENWYIGLYRRLCARVIRKHATMILGVTEAALDYMADGHQGGHVIKNPIVDLQKFDPTKYPTTPHTGINLILVGSIQPRKNQKFAVEVLKELIDMGEDAKLTFIGYPSHPESDYLPNIMEYIQANALDEKVVFLPKDSNVAESLADSDIMLIPSLQEGLPNVALEAQAMGVPCFVSTDVSEACDCGLCTFIPLQDGAHKWAQRIRDYKNESALKKRYIDMREWDNREVCKFHLRIWRGEDPFSGN